MTLLRRIEADPIVPEVLPAFLAALRMVGCAGFYRTFIRVLKDTVPVDRLYLIEGAAGAVPLIAETEPEKPPVPASTYISQFLPSDPLQAAIDMVRDPAAVVRLQVSPRDIVVPRYRAMLERAGVVERVSFVQQHDKAWRCLTVVRRAPSAAFGAAELDWLGGFFRLATALIDRHRLLVGEVVQHRADRIAELEARFTLGFPALTPRETQVCARAAIGVSIEGAALDLGIGISSVLTYRKRAYRRLGVTSAYELARLVMR
ncbi:helix-turn-helix transcriptional regulator [Sphingomonas sp. AR_OL41]|uniref:helix-turn-helix transcriptional regulator n=1 Tax=Sphingomonas sp. AR_OL41 TaxID=3042729 RepID=UPI00247FA557|nr:helix-turn-helix transcriptional regulator [Sphingomonas sp. AR_OL41]MDH7971912.1 helix-turn-helix transcriptional regulator [Sphingomonas sp. AR_OL41]